MKFSLLLINPSLYSNFSPLYHAVLYRPGTSILFVHFQKAAGLFTLCVKQQGLKDFVSDIQIYISIGN